ncbi:hypothetical protein BBF96_06065 [Anoxybacter fermentans]|uniref:Uncharacterized protein n=1 Tax=Anoxybacter fermentans TaxID=1323375 RepID=A0A3S9SXD7_9FIRM|nr:hypothetical protein [Anoxybacter fermentans]AZR72997.1 hypothetical protein BBF96_06065 [Anoxybacter fermentans]
MPYPYMNVDPNKINGDFKVPGFSSANQMKRFNNSRIGKSIASGLREVGKAYTSKPDEVAVEKGGALIYHTTRSIGRRVGVKAALKAGIKKTIGGPISYIGDIYRFCKGFVRGWSQYGK